MASRCAEPAELLRIYFDAKDGNRPELMREVFCEDACLNMRVQSQAVAFPAETHGLEAITDVLVRRFGQTYENVRSFYLARPAQCVDAFSCGWLVGMAVRGSGELRVGCGRYDWAFSRDESALASRLDIAIDEMQVLPAQHAANVDPWLAGLGRPWSSPAEVLAAAPDLPALAPVLRQLREMAQA